MEITRKHTDEEYALILTSGRYFCLKNKTHKEYPNITICLSEKEARELQEKRKLIGEHNDLYICSLSTQWGKLSVYNCEKYIQGKVRVNKNEKKKCNDTKDQ
jgi:predicted nucleic acid-binding protein